MLPSAVISNARSLLDEFGVSSAFWSDANDLYPYATDAEQEAAHIICQPFLEFRKKGLLYHSPSLAPLIKEDPLNTTTIGSSYQEYNLPSDFMYSYTADYDSTGGTNRKQSTLVTFEEARTRSNISLIAPDANNPVHYTRLTKLGFFPQSTGAGANAYKHYYIFNPPAVTSPGSTPFTLGPETHKAIEAYVVAMGLMKDGRTNEAAEWFKKFYSTIGGLV